MLSWIPDPIFFPSRIPDPWVKKATDPRFSIRIEMLSAAKKERYAKISPRYPRQNKKKIQYELTRIATANKERRKVQYITV